MDRSFKVPSLLRGVSFRRADASFEFKPLFKQVYHAATVQTTSVGLPLKETRVGSSKMPIRGTAPEGDHAPGAEVGLHHRQPRLRRWRLWNRCGMGSNEETRLTHRACCGLLWGNLQIWVFSAKAGLQTWLVWTTGTRLSWVLGVANGVRMEDKVENGFRGVWYRGYDFFDWRAFLGLHFLGPWAFALLVSDFERKNQKLAETLIWHNLASSLTENERKSAGNEQKSAGNKRKFADTHQSHFPIERVLSI